MVIHDTEEKKFKIECPEGTARMEYEENAGAVTVLHTNVPEVLAGRGLAALLAETAAALLFAFFIQRQGPADR